MFKDISRARLVGMWFAAVAVLSACGVAGGAPLTASMAELWLVACLVPPAVMLLVWPGAPAVTVAEVLYAIDNPDKDGQ